MATKEVTGCENPNYDKRVKTVMQIDTIFVLLRRLATLTGFGLLLGLLLANTTKAQSIPDMFMVPIVRLTPSGAAVLQPQTGDGYSFLQQPGESYNPSEIAVTSTNSGNTTVSDSGKNTSNNSKAGEYFGNDNYIPPRYDAFSTGSMSEQVTLPPAIIKQIDTVDFKVRNDMPSSRDAYSGTTKTVFTFTADVSSMNFRSGEMEYRWDFENDGVLNSYFSTLNSITHTYKTPGTYEVKLEVLDSYGRINSVIKKVIIVANNAPSASFKVDRISSPVNSIFRFDTSYSTDNQYDRSLLFYRFDWNGDGTWDTSFQKKSTWNHLYRETGTYNVIMEVIDPEGSTSRAEITLNVLNDLPPTARFSTERISDFNYRFDASQSSDDHTSPRNLKYRWDFNYSGPDDIVFDTSWSSSNKVTGSYQLGGTKMIRLQVKDEQGFIDETFANINVPWTEKYVNMAVQILS